MIGSLLNEKEIFPIKIINCKTSEKEIGDCKNQHYRNFSYKTAVC